MISGMDVSSEIVGMGESFRAVLSIVSSLLPFILPFILGKIIFDTYIRWKRLVFVSKIEPVLMEIRFPAMTDRPVSAMELVLNVLDQVGYGLIGEVYLDGFVRPWFSLEIVSLGGNVRFYIWTWKKFTYPLEQVFYSQFPEIEIHYAPDFAESLFHNPSERIMWAADFALAKSDAYPIKTYVDYELNKNPKEEYKVDPLTPLIEALGAISSREKFWVQILITGHRPTTWKEADLSNWTWYDAKERSAGVWKWGPGSEVKGLSWRDRIDDEIKKIIESASKKSKDKDGNEFLSPPTFEPGQDETIKTLRRHQAKPHFDTLIRSIYIAEQGAFNSGNITGMLTFLKPFAGLNSFKLGKKTDVDDGTKDLVRIFPYFKNVMSKRKKLIEIDMLNAMKLRSRFSPPYNSDDDFTKPYVMSTEEIASLFHPIGLVSKTPTLNRIDAKKSEPPTNLPV